ncbi:hypothetical protein C8A03DRAFT_35432 [Achaetomium macrosporum]|uniref:HTH APSES-type domain-containing protein n=1 Tax=Achaetomium macrosporum TaxID=79813 RepID=A0AAN7H608_9PEZI|nr:hypothetical protein C8A03DRAFT_35432 [Achaetomium macrosporum]
MVSVAELLNPEPARAPLPSSRPAPHSPARQTSTFRNEAAAAARPSVEMLRMVENIRGPSRSKIKGVVNFPPFESLDEASLLEVRRFHVHPFGSIQETSERIPYNSGKKDFFIKTGREGFEVFHYDFKFDGDDFTVMWDYNVGLVRMTPFFKCRGFPKTTPAKMLNQNPGLKDITHSITGGSIKAQGYWMPFSCAKAVCATFCHKFAGALIPLFGPQFPYECIPEKAPGYDRMIINQDIVNRAKREAAALFGPRLALPSPRPSRSISPQLSQRPARIPETAYAHHNDHDRRLLLSPCTDTDTEYHPVSEHYTRRTYPPVPPPPMPTRPPIPPLPASAPVPTPLDSPTWAAHNLSPPQHPAAHHHHRDISQLNEELLGLNVSSTAHPWLSAVPRSPTPGTASRLLHPCYPRLHHHHLYPYHHQTSPTSPPTREWPITLPPIRLKRRYDQVDPDILRDTNNNNNNNDKHDTGGGSDVESPHLRLGRSSTPPSTLPTTSSHYSWARQQHQPHQQQQQQEGNHHNTPPSPPHRTPRTPPVSESTDLESPLSAASSPSEINNKNARPEAERDAAMMLMQMRADSDKSSIRSSPSSSVSNSNRNSTGPVLPHHRGDAAADQHAEEGEEEDDTSGNGRTTTKNGGGRRGGDGDGADGDSISGEEKANIVVVLIVLQDGESAMLPTDRALPTATDEDPIVAFARAVAEEDDHCDGDEADDVGKQLRLRRGRRCAVFGAGAARSIGSCCIANEAAKHHLRVRVANEAARHYRRVRIANEAARHHWVSSGYQRGSRTTPAPSTRRRGITVLRDTGVLDRLSEEQDLGNKAER